MTRTTADFDRWATRLMVVLSQVGPSGAGVGSMVRIAGFGASAKGMIGATQPRGSDQKARHSFQREAHDDLIGSGISIVRAAGGLIVEDWVSEDTAGLMRQLSADAKV